NILSRVRELLGSIGLVASSVRRIASGFGESMSIDSSGMHLTELIFQYPDSDSASASQYEGENSHPDRSDSRSTSSLVGGCLILLSGFSLIPFAFYISDEPSPPITTKGISFIIWIIAAVTIWH